MKSAFRKHDFDANQSFYNLLTYQSDSLYSSMRLSSAQRQAINATDAYIYQLNQTELFMNQYSKCLVLAIHRKNIGDAHICYFYNPESEMQVRKEMNRNIRMMQFKPDSEFNPILMK
ncbi:hypothetical protein [Chitinophaga jiangningensis]|nr:hypothetical protein [Chitinophaga jiangningensis]